MTTYTTVPSSRGLESAIITDIRFPTECACNMAFSTVDELGGVLVLY